MSPMNGVDRMAPLYFAENRKKILDALQISVAEMMRTMAMAEVVFAGRETTNRLRMGNEASGLVYLSGGHKGMIGVSCDLNLLRQVVSCIVGVAPDDLNTDDLLDGVAELANMVGGGMKSLAQVPDVAVSSPVAIIGKDHIAEWKTDKTVEILTFQMDKGILQIYTSL